MCSGIFCTLVNTYPVAFPWCKPQAHSTLTVNVVSWYHIPNSLPKLTISSCHAFSLKSKTSQIFINVRSKTEKVSTERGNQYQIPHPRKVLHLCSILELPREPKKSPKAQASLHFNYIIISVGGTWASIWVYLVLLCFTLLHSPEVLFCLFVCLFVLQM